MPAGLAIQIKPMIWKSVKNYPSKLVFSNFIISQPEHNTPVKNSHVIFFSKNIALSSTYDPK